MCPFQKFRNTELEIRLLSSNSYDWVSSYDLYECMYRCSGIYVIPQRCYRLFQPKLFDIMKHIDFPKMVCTAQKQEPMVVENLHYFT